MVEEQSKYQLKLLALTAIVVAFIISAIWAWIWNDTKQQNHMTSRSYLDRIEALEQQLQQRGQHEQDLLDRYSDVSDIRTSLENNLTAATIKMEYMRENLTDYQHLLPYRRSCSHPVRTAKDLLLKIFFTCSWRGNPWFIDGCHLFFRL